MSARVVFLGSPRPGIWRECLLVKKQYQPTTLVVHAPPTPCLDQSHSRAENRGYLLQWSALSRIKADTFLLIEEWIPLTNYIRSSITFLTVSSQIHSKEIFTHHNHTNLIVGALYRRMDGFLSLVFSDSTAKWRLSRGRSSLYIRILCNPNLITRQ